MAEFALLVVAVTDTVAWLVGLIVLMLRWSPTWLLDVLRSTSVQFPRYAVSLYILLYRVGKKSSPCLVARLSRLMVGLLYKHLLRDRAGSGLVEADLNFD